MFYWIFNDFLMNILMIFVLLYFFYFWIVQLAVNGGLECVLFDSWHCSDFVVAKVSPRIVYTSKSFFFSDKGNFTRIYNVHKVKYTIAFAYLKLCHHRCRLSVHIRHCVGKSHTQKSYFINFTLFPFKRFAF